MTTQNLLVELFVEELPPKALPALGESFARTLAASLQAQGLAAANSVITPYASPRRLAAHLTIVAAKAADKAVAQKLMPASVGLDAEGQATQALLKKLAALGLDADATQRLRREGEGKAETLFIDTVAPGASLAEGLQKALAEAIAKLPIPKVMAYQLADGWSTVKFVRPAHGLVALHGGDIVSVQALGLTAGRETHGHRFEAQADPIVLRSADSYAEQLREEGAVIAGFEDRSTEMIRQLRSLAHQCGATLEAERGMHLQTDAEVEQNLLDHPLVKEVTALVERPNVLLCQFDPAFLAVPQECLILTMKANQKYFPLLDAAGKLTHRFLVVSNISPADPSAVVQGNERVVRPRLADAQFFFEQDRKKRLEDRVPGLDKVVYHAKLGSQGERVERVRAIARGIARQLGWPADRAALVDRAAQLAKADLLTDMVGEFPELQGIMGRYYALHDGESAVVAEAIEDHYKPRFAGDELPRSDVGIIVALADKLETLTGLFGAGESPTGDKDPYALRRHALGIIRMLTERADAFGTLHFVTLVDIASREAVIQLGVANATDFIYDRFSNSLREQGWAAQEVDAVMPSRPRFADALARLAAVRAFAALPEAAPLSAINKRVGNILKKSLTEPGQAPVPEMFDPALLREPAERQLDAALAAVEPQARTALAHGDYTAALKALAALKIPVDTFFEQVMVNAEDPALRANRLALLARLQSAMNQVADLSRLAA